MAGTTSQTTPIWARGSRKNAHCRVRVVPGNGTLLINQQSMDGYFGGHGRQIFMASQPLKHIKTLSQYDVFAEVAGGGITGYG